MKGSKFKNVLLRRDSSYKRMLEKCVQELFTDEEQTKHNFYIADTRGVAVWSGDSIAMDLEGSGERTKECEWTLGKYIKLSRIKFPSKARFFCVKKEKGYCSISACSTSLPDVCSATKI